jgi:hypothetical protein
MVVVQQLETDIGRAVAAGLAATLRGKNTPVKSLAMYSAQRAIEAHGSGQPENVVREWVRQSLAYSAEALS